MFVSVDSVKTGESSLVIWERSVYRLRGEGVTSLTLKELRADLGLLNLWGKTNILNTTEVLTWHLHAVLLFLSYWPARS